MKRLLCATDLLPKSECAIDRAGILAREIDADLSLLHVVSPTASQRILEQSLQIAIARMKSRVRPPMWRGGGPTPCVLVRTGNPARLILDTVTDEETDVLIIGPHRKRAVVDALEGTIAQKVLSAGNCALLMVQRPADAEYRNVLLALDLSADSSGVVKAAESLLHNTEARATVVHACEPQYDLTLLPPEIASVVARPHGSQHSAAIAIHDLLNKESTDSSRYEIAVSEGRPVPTLERAIEFHRPDLLILGTRGNGPLRRALLGSVANRLLKTVGCDVLVVPRGSVETSNVAKQKTSAAASVHRA